MASRVVEESHGVIEDATLQTNSWDSCNITEVPAASWCVTKNDLRDFRCRALQAVRDGSVRPTVSDDFDVADERVGPCIHTVNEQLIKPVTAAAGSASWALMRHPQGLPCDLFITHAWNEGIFEFIEKVLHSWPRGARHAFCCMLSMPQNACITGLIDNPRVSPFAAALRASRSVLAVPNRRCSIYTRIWCVYEAHLACVWGKPIFVATAPLPRFYSRIATAFLCACGAGLGARPLCTFVVTELGGMPEAVAINLLEWISAGLCVVSVGLDVLTHRISCNPLWSDAVVYGISAAGGLYAGGCAFYIARFEVRLSYCLACVLFSALPCIICAERLLFAHRRQQSAELLTDFTGKLRDAKSSKEVDKARILDDVSASGEERIVEDAIKVLVSAGMCTPHIRKASALLGHPVGPSELSFAPFVACAVAFLGLPMLDLCEFRTCSGPSRWLNWLILAEGAACLGLLAGLPLDRQGCSASVMILAFPSIVVTVMSTVGLLPPCTMQPITAFLVCPLLIAIALAGPAGVAQIPYFGPPIVRLLMNQSRLCSQLQVWWRPSASDAGLGGHRQGGEEHCTYVVSV